MNVPALGGLMRRRDVAEFLAMSVATLKRRERDDPSFPTVVVISERVLGYRTTELLEWVATRPSAVPNQAATAAACAALAAKRLRAIR